MLKRIDYLYHFTGDFPVLMNILNEGFKPSYAKEILADKNIIVPMVSFSNILLRDVGTEEVLNYGSYAVCLSREWGIRNSLNPVVYTYDEGALKESLNTFFYHSIFLSRVGQFKSYMKKISDGKLGKFSTIMSLTNTPHAVIDTLDYLTEKYDESLVDILNNLFKTVFDANLGILKLTKHYKVMNGKGVEFIAYNDREWRKLYHNLDFHVEGSNEYATWTKTQKPHYNEDEFRLRFGLEDLEAILVKNEEEIKMVCEELSKLYGEENLESRLKSKILKIGTKEFLEANNF